MSPGRRLLLLSCSQSKRAGPDLLPAIERYNGPAFRVLRRFLQERPDAREQLAIFILSAAYGLIPADHLIAWYDQAMTPQRAAELHEKVLTTFAELVCAGYADLCLAMSRKYLKALEGWTALVPSGVSVTVADGPQGIRLARLKCWLWGQETKTQHEEVSPSGSSLEHRASAGVAYLRQVELRLTPDQALEQVREALARDSIGANRFREWYIEMDGKRIAPKWLVSVLTGLPVSVFTAREARWVLQQLGIRTQHIAQEEVTGNEIGSY